MIKIKIKSCSRIRRRLSSSARGRLPPPRLNAAPADPEGSSATTRRDVLRVLRASRLLIGRPERTKRSSLPVDGLDSASALLLPPPPRPLRRRTWMWNIPGRGPTSAGPEGRLPGPPAQECGSTMTPPLKPSPFPETQWEERPGPERAAFPQSASPRQPSHRRHPPSRRSRRAIGVVARFGGKWRRVGLFTEFAPRDRKRQQHATSVIHSPTRSP